MSRSIISALHRLDGGCLMDLATDEQAKVVQAVEATGKPGTVTIKITYRKAGGGALALAGKVTSTTPKEAPTEALLFPTPEGDLVAEDPKQNKLELRPVPAEQARELKTLQG